MILLKEKLRNTSYKNTLNSTFRYNDAIIRSMVLRRSGPISIESPIMSQENSEKAERQAKEVKAATSRISDSEKQDIPAEDASVVADSVQSEINENSQSELVEQHESDQDLGEK